MDPGFRGDDVYLFHWCARHMTLDWYDVDMASPVNELISCQQKNIYLVHRLSMFLP